VKKAVVFLCLLGGCCSTPKARNFPIQRGPEVPTEMADLLVERILLSSAPLQTATLFCKSPTPTLTPRITVAVREPFAWIPRSKMLPLCLYWDVEVLPPLIKKLKQLALLPADKIDDKTRFANNITTLILLISHILSWHFEEEPLPLSVFVPVPATGSQGKQHKNNPTSPPPDAKRCTHLVKFARQYLRLLEAKLKALTSRPDPKTLTIVHDLLKTLQNSSFSLAADSTEILLPDKPKSAAQTAYKESIKLGLKAIPALLELTYSEDSLLAFLLLCRILRFSSPLHTYLARFVTPCRATAATADPLVRLILAKEITRLHKLARMVRRGEDRDK